MSQPSPHLRYQKLQSYVGWTDTDALRVRSLAPLVTPHIHDLIEDFQVQVERHPEARQIVTGGTEQIHRLKTTLAIWLTELFSGPYDQAYVERRWHAGYHQAEMGLDQVYTNTVFSRLRQRLLSLIERHWQGDFGEMLAARSSLNLLLDLDLAIIQDAYQTEYRRRQGVTERLATVGKIAGGIAHELRNSLNVVKISLYYLLHAQNASPEKVKTHLERIERQVGVADGIITAINDFARLPFPHIEPIEVETCLREALELTPLPDDVEVHCRVVPASLVVLGDRAQLLIVFGNLIRNAFEAMPHGGILRIEAIPEGRHALIRVHDTGMGIAPEDMPHVLEPLYSTKTGGIGLGLSIINDIVRRHQGTLTISSPPGGGSTFTVRLNAPPGTAEGN